MKYQQHPLSASWSAMDEEAFKALIDDIDANGVRNAIVLYEGKILDGWHRYRACAELNVKKPPMIEYDGGDPAGFVLSMNLHRRHGSQSQVAFAIADMANWVEASGRPSASVASALKMSVMKAAAIAGVSERTMADAKAATTAVPEVRDAVMKGDMPVSKAAKLAKQSPEKQREAVNKPEPKAPVKREETVPLSQYTKLQQEYEELSQNYHAMSIELSACEAIRNGVQVAEFKKLHGQIMSLTQSRDEWQNKCAEQTRQLNYLSNKMKKNEK
jgi:ParB-like chromosome segregation protein Spo0J